MTKKKQADIGLRATVLAGILVAVFSYVLTTVQEDHRSAKLMLINMHLKGISERHQLQCEAGLPISDIEEMQ